MTATRPAILCALLVGCGGLSAPITQAPCDPALDPTCTNPSPTGPGTGAAGTGTGTGSGDTGTTGATGEICDDEIDNDGDENIDCADNECAAHPSCDADTDGYADELLGGTDCDDSNPAINPGAVESCDGVDNDCDGGTDEDGDGDGSDACADCDDLDAGIYPGAYDPCGDGVDADCNGSDSCSDWTKDFEAGALSPLVGAGTIAMTVSTANAHGGTRSAEGSHSITDNQNSCMTVVLNYAASGQISFWSSVDSESGYDYLTFYVDGTTQEEWSGSVAWAEHTYPVAVGSHTMQWCYRKDVSLSTGQDTGWVDDITAVGGIP